MARQTTMLIEILATLQSQSVKVPIAYSRRDSIDDSHMGCSVVLSVNDSFHQISSIDDSILPNVGISAAVHGVVLNSTPENPIESFGSANTDFPTSFLAVPKAPVAVLVASASKENNIGFVPNPNMLIKSSFHRNIKGDEHTMVLQFQIRDTRLSWKGRTTNRMLHLLA
ncbi:hypothetical protein L1987_11381 [Smallanthus sonchifolius]|uniref:Uncharacterized protein n=1 Tax=Smallanthus sonchifolius TaxID=185202 RepID=A0ACB9JCY6_9ASTR|nr:hypothetical protein L1987_11381 [Smallanthus sonchifolius]